MPHNSRSMTNTTMHQMRQSNLAAVSLHPQRPKLKDHKVARARQELDKLVLTLLQAGEVSLRAKKPSAGHTSQRPQLSIRTVRDAARGPYLVNIARRAGSPLLRQHLLLALRPCRRPSALLVETSIVREVQSCLRICRLSSHEASLPNQTSRLSLPSMPRAMQDLWSSSSTFQQPGPSSKKDCNNTMTYEHPTLSHHHSTKT